MTVIHSVLAGLLLIVAGWWALVAFNRLQQQWLLGAAGSAMARAEARGLVLQPLGFRARVVARGPGRSGAAIVVQWRTGLLGPRTVVRTSAGRRRLPLVADGAALDRLLDGG